MRKHASAFILASLLWTAGASAQPGGAPVPFDELPPAAKATIEREAKGRQIVAIIERAGSNGDVVYEAQVVADTRDTVGIAVDQRGSVINHFYYLHAAGLDGR